jgi:hypothetical protein
MAAWYKDAIRRFADNASSDEHMSLKNPGQILRELLQAANPPVGCNITVTKDSGTPNWITDSGLMPLPCLSNYRTKLIALRASDPIIDWSAVPTGTASARISQQTP